MRRSALVLVLALTAACGAGASGGTERPRPARRDPNLVLADEIAKQGGGNLYDILRALRPQWFIVTPTRITRGAVMADAVVIYLDGRRIGTPPVLSEIAVTTVVQVRFYSASEAQGRFGMGNLQGAIDVVTAR